MRSFLLLATLVAFGIALGLSINPPETIPPRMIFIIGAAVFGVALMYWLVWFRIPSSRLRKSGRDAERLTGNRRDKR